MIAGSFVAATGGAFLLLAWWQNRTALPMLWWAGANFAFAAGLPLSLQSSHVGSPSMVVGITLLNLGPAFIWASGRSSNLRDVDMTFLAAGAVIWLTVSVLPVFRSMPGAQATINQSMIAVYLFAAAREFYHRRAEQVTARHPLIVLLVLHGLYFCYGAFESVRAGWETNAYAIGLWFNLLHFETLIFVVGTSIFAVAMMREQSELTQRIQASTDELTGLHNRRAFYREGKALLSATLARQTNLSVVVFDLDGFKSINDRFGHRRGDNILKLFGETTLTILRSSDIIGRIGGEEFAAILPNASAAEAYEIAERVRIRFAEASAASESDEFRATMSAGIVESDRSSSLDALIGQADTALYRAKDNGRNRVEIYQPDVEEVGTVGAIASAA